MKYLVLVPALLAAAVAAARAQDAIPDLKGTWTGKGKAVVFGNNPHHPGSQTAADAPRVHEIEATHVVEGQDGRLAWGHSSSAAADTKEPFAWAISADDETILGADQDGYFQITLLSTDQMEKCYVQNGNGPTHAIVAACYTMNRMKH
ncbi:MAG TPA: hypothetical protein VH678_30645 [Xanthobacteraceae bacterium]|jgi:hypothetical protein